MVKTVATPKGWRAVLPIHPAAEMLPPMSAVEAAELQADIEKNGLFEPIMLHKDKKTKKVTLLDGRHRADAMQALGKNLFDKDGRPKPGYFQYLPGHIDPFVYVLSKNLHRRHLTPAQKREIIDKLLIDHPELSNREIAKLAKDDHKKVARRRDKLVARGAMPHVETRTDSLGRKQPAYRVASPAITPEAEEERPRTRTPEEQAEEERKDAEWEAEQAADTKEWFEEIRKDPAGHWHELVIEGREDFEKFPDCPFEPVAPVEKWREANEKIQRALDDGDAPGFVAGCDEVAAAIAKMRSYGAAAVAKAAATPADTSETTSAAPADTSEPVSEADLVPPPDGSPPKFLDRRNKSNGAATDDVA